MNPELFLPQIEKLLEDARHIRNRLEVHDGTERALKVGDAVVEAIVMWQRVVTENV